MAKTFQKRRWLVPRGPEFLLRDSPRSRLLDNHILVDALIPEMPSEAFGEPFAAGKRASGNGDRTHFMMVASKRLARRIQA
jgi:hypothetical protein